MQFNDYKNAKNLTEIYAVDLQEALIIELEQVISWSNKIVKVIIKYCLYFEARFKFNEKHNRYFSNVSIAYRLLLT